MENFDSKFNRLTSWFAIFYTMLIVLLNFIAIKLSLIFIFGLSIVTLFHFRPQYALFSLIFLAPFSGTELLSNNIGGIPGLKIANVIFFIFVLAYVFSKEKFKIKNHELSFFIGVLFVLLICTIRSIPNLDYINFYFEETMGTGKYFLVNFVKPAFYLLPFLVILGYVHSKDDIEFVASCFKFSMLFLSAFVLIFYLFQISNKGSFENVQRNLIQLFNMHTNDFVNFYIIGFPIVLALFLCEKSLVNTLNVVLTLSCIVILYSRTAYILTVFSTFMLLLIMKRRKLLPIIIIFGIFSVSISPSTVVQRGMTGIEERNIEKISSGRMQSIWVPILEKSIQDPIGFLIGKGRFSIIYSTSIDKGHPHNMYLEIFLDAGIAGLSFFVIFLFYFIYYLKRGINFLPEGKQKTILGGILVSIVAFMISGLTGRHLFPDITNSYLWIVMAIGLLIIKSIEREKITPIFSEKP